MIFVLMWPFNATPLTQMSVQHEASLWPLTEPNNHKHHAILIRYFYWDQ